MVPSLGVCRIALSEQVAQRPAELVRVDLDRQRRTSVSPTSRTPFARATGSALASASSTRSPAATRSRCSRIGPSTRDSSNRSSTICGQPVDLDPELAVVAAHGLRVGDDAVLQRLDHGPHAGQRGAQVVAHAGDQLAAAGLGGLHGVAGADQPGMGAVERGRHGAQLAGRHSGGAVEGRVADLHRRVGQRAAGAAQRSAEQQRDPDRRTPQPAR